MKQKEENNLYYIMTPFYYNEITLIAMNNAYNNTIKIEKKEENDLYYLYPTNILNLHKRQYIALPINIDIKNNNIKQKYNLI